MKRAEFGVERIPARPIPLKCGVSSCFVDLLSRTPRALAYHDILTVVPRGVGLD